MAYIGNTAPSRFVSNRAASVYSGDGSTVAFTLEQVVTQDEDVLVSVDGVVQEPSVAYAVSSGTTLTFTAAPSSNSGNNIFVYYLASQTGTVGHPSSQALSATNGTFTGKVGILGANDLGLGLHIKEADSGASSVSTDADQLVIENSAESGITLLAGTSSASRIAFGDSGNSKIGMVYYNHGSNYMQFSTNDTGQMKIDSTGAVTKPNQPAFLVKPATTQSNIANDTTIVFGTEKFDQNADFASNTFTAPVTGKYQLNFMGRVDQIDAAANWQRLTLVTSNTTYEGQIFDLGGLSGDPAYWNFTINVLADMDASDTAFIKWQQDGGSNQADITEQVFFSGYLVA